MVSKKLLMVLLALAAVVVRAEQSIPTWIKVGDDGIYVADVSYPYTFPSSGAVLNRTQGGYRLDLNGVLIKPGAFEGSAILADGDLTIYLEGENFIEGGNSADIYLSSMRTCSHNLTIFGTGKLTVMAASSSFSQGIYACDDISITAGATVSVYGGEAGGMVSEYGNVLLSGCMVGVYGSSGWAIQSHGSISVLAAMLSVQTTGYGVYASDNIVVDAAIVNAFTPSTCFRSNGFYASHSYLAMAATSLNDCSVLRSGEVAFDGCVAKIVGFTTSDVQCSRCVDAADVVLGEGDYYIGLNARRFAGNENKVSNSCGVFADNLVVCGGNVRVCAPGVSCVMANVDIESGLMETQKKFNMAEMFKYDAGIVVGYTAAIGAGLFDVSTASVDFYTQFFLDALSNGLMSNIEGASAIAVDIGYGVYVQNGGTVMGEGAIHGIVTCKYAPVLNGGSCNAAFQLADVGGSGWVYYATAPCSVHDGVTDTNLKRITYTVPGASKYDKITQSWTGILPSYYGTGSLYADGGGKLYFWVPETWSVVEKSGKTCKVTFNANGGSGGKTKSVAKGKAVGTLPKATKKGYTLKGWYTKKSGGTKVKTSTKITKTVTYYAQWTANKYKIKFNANGGKGTMKTLSATYGKTVALRANAFKKSKYRFAGWAKKKNGKVAYKNKAKMKNLTATNGKTVTLYAVWKKAKSASAESVNVAKSASVAAVAVPKWAVGTVYGDDEGGEN